jgi:capsular polysaccharide export protein
MASAAIPIEAASPEPVAPLLRLVVVDEPIPARHFLFLQGMPGPFFRRLGAELRQRGSLVSRINFNGGDWADWRGADAIAYRDTLEAWPDWLREHVRTHAVTDIVVFGDCRDHHGRAHAVADREGLRFWAFEEGYLRPDHVTLEQGGVNGRSSFPRSLHALRLLADRLPAADETVSIANRFRTRAGEATRHHVAAIAMRPLFANYRTHRSTSPAREGLGWVGRLFRRSIERRASNRALERLGDRAFFMHPLQIEGDSQLRFHSPFASMVEAMQQIVTSFASVPGDTLLLIKMHPLDPGVLPWRRLVAEAAAQAGAADRVLFVERADLIPLLDRALGVVTVNSTVGPLALARGTPVMALGDAIYRVAGVTADDDLAAFWRGPDPVDAANFDLLCRALRAKCLVNGGFHSAAAVKRLVGCSADRMLRR